MSLGDVHNREMNEPTDVDDATADAFLLGSGRDLDPALALAVLAIRDFANCTPSPNDALVQLMRPAPRRRRPRLRTRRWRAKIGTAVAVAIAATGGLATAHALPAPAQDAISRLGIGRPAHAHPPDSDVSASHGGSAQDAPDRSRTGDRSGSGVVGVPRTTVMSARPGASLGAVPATVVGDNPSSCAARAPRVAITVGSSPTKTCSTVGPAPTPPHTAASPNGGTNAGGNGTSHAGGNATSHAGGNGTSSAGGKLTTHAGGNTTTQAGGNDKTNAGGNRTSKTQT
jgi:hypothetical protein